MSIDNTTSGVSARNVVYAEGPNPASNTNPIQAELMSDGSVAAFWRSVASAHDYLTTTAYEQLGQIDESWREQSYRVENDTTRTAQYKANQNANIQSVALQSIATVLKNAQAKRDAIVQACEMALHSAAPKDPTAALLAVTARDGAWQRLAMRLGGATAAPGLSASNAFTTLMDLVQRAARDNDDATIAAARYYAAAYLSQFGGSGMDEASIGRAIDDATAASRAPIERAAMQVLEDLRIGWPRLAMAIDMTRGMLRDAKGIRVTTLPGWDGTNTRISQWGL